MSAIVPFPSRRGASIDEANDPAATRADGRLPIRRDETRLDAVTLWVDGWLDLRAAMRLVDECRTRLLQGQRVLVDLSDLDGIDDDAVEALSALSAQGCLLFNAARSLFPDAASHIRDRRMNAR